MNDRDEQPDAGVTSLYWKTRPIFVSSTFRDMHLERDFLRDNAFKRLEERLRKRCVFLELIDLRQGVETIGEKNEILREMKVLKVCLDEIGRSRPFIVAFLGDRYGYVPSDDQILLVAQAVGLPRPERVKGKSITELEIVYGALENAQQLSRCWFFFRDLDRRGMPPEEARKYPTEEDSGSARKLGELKSRIEKAMPDRVVRYTLIWSVEERRVVGLADFDAKVEEMLWRDLDADTSQLIRPTPRSWQDAESRVLADFVSENLRAYVERPGLVDPLIAFAQSQGISGGKQVLVMAGPSGSGKSSLFSKTYALLSEQASQGDLFLLAHAAGLFPGSEQIDRMMRRWVHEITGFLQVPDPLTTFEGADSNGSAGADAGTHEKSLSEEIEETFWAMVARAAGKARIVLLIDALDQFEPTVRAKCLTWIPSGVHANVRLIATSAPCDAVAHAAKAGTIEVRPIAVLSEAEAKQLAEKVYRELYHHAPCEPALEALLSKKQPNPTTKVASLLSWLRGSGLAHRPMAYNNPLWLTLALHELNLLGLDDFEHADQKYNRFAPVKRLTALQIQKAGDLPELVEDIYVNLFRRAERVCGAQWVKHLLSLLVTSRFGLRERDLSILMPQLTGDTWDALTFANIRRIFGRHILQRGSYGQWALAYAGLRSAITRHYRNGEDKQVAMHGLLGMHLVQLPDDDGLRIHETMHHLINFGESEIAASYIAYLAFPDSDRNLRMALDAATATIAEKYHLATAAEDLAHIAHWLAQVLRSSKYISRVAHVFICNLYPHLTRSFDVKMMASTQRLLTDTLKTLEGQLAAGSADAWLEHDTARCCELLGDICRSVGAVDKAQAYSDQALALREQPGTRSATDRQLLFGLPSSYCTRGDSFLDSGSWAQAGDWYGKAREVAEELCRREPQDAHFAMLLSFCYRKLGRLSFTQGDLGKAREWFERALEQTSRIRLSSKRSHEEIECLGGLATLFAAGNDFDQALVYETRATTAIEEMRALDPQDSDVLYALSGSYNKKAGIHIRMGNIALAQQCLAKALGFLKELKTLNPHVVDYARMTAIVLIELGNTYRKGAAYKAAEDHYVRASAIGKDLCDGQPSNCTYVTDYAIAVGSLGLLYLEQGRKKDAMDCLMKATSLLVTIAGTGDGRVKVQLDRFRHIILHTNWS